MRIALCGIDTYPLYLQIRRVHTHLQLEDREDARCRLKSLAFLYTRPNEFIFIGNFLPLR
jgi:hypothetical protein